MNQIFKTYDYDDLLLVPRLSIVNSRDDVDISVDLGKGLCLRNPIIGSPMKGIIGIKMIVELSRLGSIGILHKFFYDDVEWADTIHMLGNLDINFGVAIGLQTSPEIWKLALDSNAKIICVDVANGYLDSVKSSCDIVADYICNNGYNALLMSGNVVTSQGAFDLYAHGVELVRVGIGTGSLCTTRTVTGVGVGQLTAIDDINGTLQKKLFEQEYKYRHSVTDYKPFRIIADGGISNSGKLIKALAMGAHAGMIGTLFGTALESEHNGLIYGMASRKLQEEYYHSVKSIEGTELVAEKVRPLEDIIKDLCYGIKSAMTYLDASTLAELEHVNWTEAHI